MELFWRDFESGFGDQGWDSWHWCAVLGSSFSLSTLFVSHRCSLGARDAADD